MKELVAKRYARALFEAISPDRLDSELDRIQENLDNIRGLFKENESFRHLILSPRFERGMKIGVLQTLLAQLQASVPVVKFFEYLVHKNRFQYLPEISRAFSSLVRKHRGILRVPISSAREAPAQDQEGVRLGLEAATGQKVQIEWSVNPSLIGGMVAQVGEAVVDGSIKGQLEAFRRRLLNLS